MFSCLHLFLTLSSCLLFFSHVRLPPPTFSCLPLFLTHSVVSTFFSHTFSCLLSSHTFSCLPLFSHFLTFSSHTFHYLPLFSHLSVVSPFFSQMFGSLLFFLKHIRLPSAFKKI